MAVIILLSHKIDVKSKKLQEAKENIICWVKKFNPARRYNYYKHFCCC